MEYKGIERRACVRFEIPGSTASYNQTKRFLSRKKHDEEFCPVVDISRGGLKYLCHKPLKINDEVSLKISIPGERVPLNLMGKVRWTSLDEEKNYKYQIGVQFYPYGEKKGQNYPGTLVKIIALEQKFAPTETLDKNAQFDIEG